MANKPVLIWAEERRKWSGWCNGGDQSWPRKVDACSPLLGHGCSLRRMLACTEAKGGGAWMIRDTRIVRAAVCVLCSLRLSRLCARTHARTFALLVWVVCPLFTSGVSVPLLPCSGVSFCVCSSLCLPLSPISSSVPVCVPVSQSTLPDNSYLLGPAVSPPALLGVGIQW